MCYKATPLPKLQLRCYYSVCPCLQLIIILTNFVGMAAADRSICRISFVDGVITVYTKNTSVGNICRNVYGYSEDFCSILHRVCLFCSCFFFILYHITWKSGKYCLT